MSKLPFAVLSTKTVREVDRYGARLAAITSKTHVTTTTQAAVKPQPARVPFGKTSNKAKGW